MIKFTFIEMFFSGQSNHVISLSVELLFNYERLKRESSAKLGRSKNKHRNRPLVAGSSKAISPPSTAISVAVRWTAESPMLETSIA